MGSMVGHEPSEEHVEGLTAKVIPFFVENVQYWCLLNLNSIAYNLL